MHHTETYQKLALALNGTRKHLWETCDSLGIIDIDDTVLESYTEECSHCGIWGSNHVHDQDGFPVCKLCYSLVGR